MVAPSKRPNPLHRRLEFDRLAVEFRTASPFPHIAIPEFLDTSFAREVAAAYPTFEQARPLGREFRALNERGKVQITSDAAFPAAVRDLSELLASRELRESFTRITGIPSLLADEEKVGGGMHLMRSGAHLDVHVDFNRIEDRDLYRRLNVLLFLNLEWRDSWGGELELWDEGVRRCERAFTPEFNLLVLFETSHRSFHGVRKVASPQSSPRLSFAGYYYTREAPIDGEAVPHDTIFRSRPNERWKGHLLMPAERVLGTLHSWLRSGARFLRRP